METWASAEQRCEVWGLPWAGGTLRQESGLGAWRCLSSPPENLIPSGHPLSWPGPPEHPQPSPCCAGPDPLCGNKDVRW